MKFLSRYYDFVSNTDFIDYLVSRDIKVTWVVEAGCHDGSDTVRIKNSLNPIRIIAFEPDNDAHIRATKTYSENNIEVELHNVGLSDKNATLFANFLNGQGGTGSTYLGEEGNAEVEVRKLDDLGLDLSYGGLLWLDVEGHATSALRGASKNLRYIAAAKVEIQMHDMNDALMADYHEVNNIMLSSGLFPVRAPIFPGFFGDVIYLNKRELSLGDKIWSYTLRLQMWLLHDFVYPLLGKPKSPFR